MNPSAHHTTHGDSANNFPGTGGSTTANLGHHSNIVDSGDNLGNSSTQGLGRTGDGHFSGQQQQQQRSAGGGLHDSGLTGNGNTMGHNTGGYGGDNINTTHRATGSGIPGETSAHHGGAGSGLGGGGGGGGGYGSTHTAGSTSTSTGNYGPHDSNLANKVDPRVDSGATTGMGGYSNNNNNNVRFETTGNRAGGVGAGGLEGSTEGHHARRGTSNSGVGVGGAGVGGVGTGGVHNQNPNSTNNGPHSSNLENKVDPRVDSDLDHRSNQHAQNPLSTNNGPHSSNLENKADPRVDSDRDHRERTHHRENTSPESFGIAPNAAGGLTGGSMGSVAEGMTRDGRRLEGTVEGPIGGTTAGAHHERVEGEGVGGVGNNTNAGPHNSNVANKADPRVDSDMDHRQNYGPNNSNNIGGHKINTPQNQNAGGYNNNSTSTHSQGQNPLSTNNGPHSSNLENKADPRIDSDMDHRGQNYGHHHNNNVNTGGYNNPGAAGSGAARQNPLSTNNGPHSNNLENKVDPRVDSDMDGRGTTIQHHQQQHNTAAAAGGAGYNNTSSGVGGLNSNNNDGRGVHNNHHHSGNLDSSTTGHNGYDSHTTNPSVGHDHSNKVGQVDSASGMYGRGAVSGSGSGGVL